MKKFVVTGGCGFIGSHLVRYLKKHFPEDKIVVIDNLSTGKIDNLFDMTGSFEMEREDIRNLRKLGKLLYGAEAVFHMAALPSVEQSVKDPVETSSVNITGTLNILEASRKNRVKRVIFSSSCAVYGDHETEALTEDLPARPLSPYAAQKYSSEHYMRLYHELYELPTVCLRYFNVYGPGQDPASDYAAAVPLFASRAKAGKQISIFGDGEQTRDFVYVKDVLNANLLAAASDRLDGRVLNIGSGVETSINCLARMIRELCGSDSEIKHANPRPGDIRRSCSNISRAGDFLAYSPETSLRDGLSKVLGSI